ncbi:alpha/beta fold hydrolase [Mycolicibacillus parakoreensis]|uniref:Alpha/beta hydrolase n=1 Tax=Mycolicibacillus parakoreensis TaxID=1069221 RepID=A0ABY3U0J9_9MYCO|nr:alpha/beta hydrolase [Mycolicibacillus parakoreensis]MCV7317285.1 alpha/beta fold hydrolase [Mycolicibacillus parakoreensis]ULN51671.2 alpha/beta hydrolase [Mycolicibacillus parakoreensis]
MSTAGLEVIEAGESTGEHPVPLLFVHGAWNGAWVWQEYFLPFFAGRGHRAVALSLRGHGHSPAPRGLHHCTIGDYVADVRAVADGLPVAPVVIGHSMGGLVVQKYLEHRDAAAAVLMGSMPPAGAFGSGLRWLRHHPWHFTKIGLTGRSLPYVSTPALARERFFSPHTPEDRVRAFAARLQEESRRAGPSSIVDRVRPRRVRTPILVLGAEFDGATSHTEVLATARAYRTAAEFFPTGHAMMFDDGWQAVAERIHGWLGERGL